MFFLCSPKLAEQGCMSADFCVVNIHVYCVSFFANKELIGWWRKLESKGTTRISSWKDSGRSTTPWYPFQSWCHRHPQTIDPGKAKESDGDITEDPRFGSQRPLGKEGCWKGPSDMSHVSRLIPPVNPLKFWDQKSSADHVRNHSSDSCHSKRSVIKISTACLGSAVRYPKGLRTDAQREENLKAQRCQSNKKYNEHQRTFLQVAFRATRDHSSFKMFQE